MNFEDWTKTQIKCLWRWMFITWLGVTLLLVGVALSFGNDYVIIGPDHKTLTGQYHRDFSTGTLQPGEVYQQLPDKNYNDNDSSRRYELDKYIRDRRENELFDMQMRFDWYRSRMNNPN